MKPLNLDNSPCSPISSNCVIWQGPNIPCIKLCTGDTITDVVYALATQLCNIVDQVNISTLDLSCLNITTGTPSNLTELLQILTDKICELNNISTTKTPTKRGNSSCPTDCIVPVADCLQTGGQTTMKLLDYIQLIGNKICALVGEITTINNSITNLDNRVTILEGIEPTPPYVLPSIVPDCTLADNLVEQGGSYKLNVILEALINDNNHGYCSLLGALGQPSEITIAYNSQTVDCTDGSLSDCSKTLQELYPSFIVNPQNLSESFIDMWLVIKDIRDAYKRYNVVAGNSNVTVTSTTVPDSCGPEITYSVKAKSASVVAGNNVTVTSNVVGDNTEYTVNATANGTSVVAGDNITVTENTSDPNNTIYTVTGKEAIVTASTNTTNTVTVTPTAGPGSNDTTYTVYSKYGLDTFAIIWIMDKNTFCPWFDIPSVSQTTVTVSGCDTNRTSSGFSITNLGGGQQIIKPNVLQTPATVGTYANTNVSVANFGLGEYITAANFNNYGCTFGTLNSDTGTFIVSEAGVYTISAYCHLKAVCTYTNADEEGKFYWSTTDGHIGLGIVDREKDNDIFCGNFQTVIGNKTTQIDITVTRTVYLKANTELGINILNATDRDYTANKLNGGDGIGFQIIKLSEGASFINI
jgi:hypothetical protein